MAAFLFYCRHFFPPQSHDVHFLLLDALHTAELPASPTEAFAFITRIFALPSNFLHKVLPVVFIKIYIHFLRGLWRSTCKVGFPRGTPRARDACLHPGNPTLHVEPELYYSTIVLVHYCTIPLFPTLLLTFILFYHDPSSLHLGNSPVPVEPGIYNSTISVLYYSTIYYFTICYFTMYFYTILPRPPAVCVSETHLCRLSQEFTIVLFYYFSTVLFHYLLFHYLLLYYFFFTILYYSTTSPSRLRLGNPPVPVEPATYYFTISVLYYSTIYYCTFCYFTIYFYTSLPRPQPFASRKPTCTG